MLEFTAYVLWHAYDRVHCRILDRERYGFGGAAWLGR